MNLQRTIPPESPTDEETKSGQDYPIILTKLKEELEKCRMEQKSLRSELEFLRNENKMIAGEAHDSFEKIQAEICSEEATKNRETIADLETRVAALQMDKESVIQLWQMALKAIRILEAELKAVQEDGHSGVGKFSEEQINSIRETYSEAIKALETKLIQAKDNFLRQQKLWDSSKEKIRTLNAEKEELERRVSDLQKNVRDKDTERREEIETLRTDLELARLEVEKKKRAQVELESKLVEAQTFVATVIAKDNETKSKVSEAIELVESAVREKELALQRETRILEERLALESNLVKIVEEYKDSLQSEVAKVKESYERSSKKYVLEMKELKVELQQKVNLLDRAQRECRLLEEELQNVRHGSENIFEESSGKIVALQERLEDAESKLKSGEDAYREKYVDRIRQLDEHVEELEQKLRTCNEHLKRSQKQNAKELEERSRDADERMTEVVDRCSNLERKLTRVVDERENLSGELRSLRATFDREQKQKEQERRLLENRVRELQEDLRKATNSVERTAAHGDALSGQINILEMELKKKCSTEKLLTIDNEHRCKADLIEKIQELREKYERKTNELTRHVETHRKLGKKWKEEAKRLAMTFQKRLKELRCKITGLRKENEELNKELLASRQQLTQFREKIIHRYDQGDTPR